MTTKEFAELIGVSRITLSKVLNGKEGVSKETELKIKEYIKKYNFIPNNSARNLVGKKNKVIGLFFKESTLNYSDSEIRSHFSTEFLNYAINQAQKYDYKVLVSIIKNEDDYPEISKMFKSALISGGILLGYSKSDKKLKEILKEDNKIVLINQEERSPSNNIGVVNINDSDGTEKALKGIIDSGHKKILYIGSKTDRLPAIRREQSFREICEINKEKLESVVLKKGDFTRKSGYDIVDIILKSEKDNLPTAILAANDIMAIGAIEAIKENGLNIPKDISVVGFDNIEVSKYISPTLSTVGYSYETIAGKAIDLIISLINDKEVLREIEIDTEFIKRGSLEKLNWK